MIASASGRNREQMDRIAVDLSKVQDRLIAVRLVDENPGGWGHLNFDDFRFHDEPPVAVAGTSAWRSTFNPLLNHLVPNRVEAEPKREDETIATMFVPEGFSVDVIAAEPDLHQPMAFTFDAKGRLWVVEGHSYPQKRPDGEGLDRVLIFADNDHDGTYETRKVFAEKLNLVSGLEVGHGGVWIGAAPQLLFIIPEIAMATMFLITADTARRLRICGHSRDAEQLHVGPGRLALRQSGSLQHIEDRQTRFIRRSTHVAQRRSLAVSSDEARLRSLRAWWQQSVGT